MISNNDTMNQNIELETISGVTWTDDDGTTYRRVLIDGEIKDIEVDRHE